MTSTADMKRITIVGDDRPGTLAEVTELLSDSGLDIRDISTKAVGDDVFLTLQVFDYDLGLNVLMENGFNAISEESVLIRIEDRPGALAAIARTLAEEGIDIRGISLVHQNASHNAVAISSDNDQRVREIFKDHLYN